MYEMCETQRIITVPQMAVMKPLLTPALRMVDETQYRNGDIVVRFARMYQLTCKEVSTSQRVSYKIFYLWLIFPPSFSICRQRRKDRLNSIIYLGVDVAYHFLTLSVTN